QQHLRGGTDVESGHPSERLAHVIDVDHLHTSRRNLLLGVPPGVLRRTLVHPGLLQRRHSCLLPVDLSHRGLHQLCHRRGTAGRGEQQIEVHRVAGIERRNVGVVDEHSGVGPAAGEGLLHLSGLSHLDGHVPGIQLRGDALPQGAGVVGEHHPPAVGSATELGTDHHHEHEREDEREEDVRPVPQEPAQLHHGHRPGRPHAATPRFGISRETTRHTAANPSMIATGTPIAPSPPPPEVIPSPRVNAAIGFRSTIVPTSPVAVIGKNAPPDMPSTSAMIDCTMFACSAVRARRTTTNVSEVAASTAVSTRAATAGTAPKSTSNSSDPMVSSTPVATTPSTNAVSALAATIVDQRTGIDLSRTNVPSSRSAISPSTPNPT